MNSSNNLTSINSQLTSAARSRSSSSTSAQLLQCDSSIMRCRRERNSDMDILVQKLAVETAKEDTFGQLDEGQMKKQVIGPVDEESKEGAQTANEDGETLVEADAKRKKLLEVNRIKARERRKRQKVQHEQEQQYILKVIRDNDELKLENDELRQKLALCQRQLQQQHMLMSTAHKTVMAPAPTLAVPSLQADRSLIQDLLMEQNRQVRSIGGNRSVLHQETPGQSHVAPLQDVFRGMVPAKARPDEQQSARTSQIIRYGQRQPLDSRDVERLLQMTHHQSMGNRRSSGRGGI